MMARIRYMLVEYFFPISNRIPFRTRHVLTDVTLALIMTILVNVMISAILIMTVVLIMEISVHDQVIIVETFKILFFLHNLLKFSIYK